LRVLVLTGNYFADNLNLGDLAIYRSLYEMLPASASVTFVSAAPEVIRIIGDRARWVSPPPSDVARDPAYWRDRVEKMDLVVASGGSWFSGLFKNQAEDVLDGLAAALLAERPTAIAGAAFEPLADTRLEAKARHVLKDVTALWVRDLASARFLAGLGVPWSRIVCHADPALRICRAVRDCEPRDVLGINLRNSQHYNPMTEGIRQTLRQSLGEFLVENPAEVRALPVSLHGPADEEAVSETWPQTTLTRLSSVEDLLAHVSDCRVVVSGSHHAAVFALGLGVPVLMVGASAHYLRKLRSLEPFFGSAARVVDLAASSASAEIGAALGELWQTPAWKRADLRRVARWHMEKGQAFIDRIVSTQSNA
jgi:polysaccharide pyruvyl transferase WcaK-like protein